MIRLLPHGNILATHHHYDIYDIINMVLISSGLTLGTGYLLVKAQAVARDRAMQSNSAHNGGNARILMLWETSH